VGTPTTVIMLPFRSQRPILPKVITMPGQKSEATLDQNLDQ